MSATGLRRFQEQVSELLLRHRSILDVLSKLDQTNASVHRAVIKSITECGCVEVKAQKQNIPEEWAPAELLKLLDTHLIGGLCENCKDFITAEIGKNLFYLSALCNLLELDLEDVVDRESQKCATLGFFNMS